MDFEFPLLAAAQEMALELRMKDLALARLQQRVAELEAENAELAGPARLHTHSCSETHPQQDIHHPGGHPHRHDPEA